jgi:hypothetical protein
MNYATAAALSFGLSIGILLGIFVVFSDLYSHGITYTSHMWKCMP